MSLWIIVLILGLVEGLTEFIPVSSTGHLILADRFLGFQQALGDAEKASLFEVVIQLGAILAIFLLYRDKLVGVALSSWRKQGPDRRLLVLLIIAFFPAAAVGFLAHNYIEDHLMSPLTVAWALVVGGVLMFVIDRLPLSFKTKSTEAMSPLQALGVGLAQVVSLFPGVSRSGATIMGGLISGMDRRTSTEFSFLLSFPIMCAASALTLFKHRDLLDGGMLTVLAVGFAAAFITAYAVVKWLIRYVQHHDFTVFAIYRILFGAVMLWIFWPRG